MGKRGRDKTTQVIPKANRYQNQNQNGNPAWGTEGGKRPRRSNRNPETKRGTDPNQDGEQYQISRTLLRYFPTNRLHDRRIN